MRWCRRTSSCGSAAASSCRSLDPPESLRVVAARCRNIGGWPVLVGEEGRRDTVLFSPIIIYDYPRIAPESAGDLFDATEIDEILSLRIMTLTDEEKAESAGRTSVPACSSSAPSRSPPSR